MRPQSLGAEDDILIQSRGETAPVFHITVLCKILPLKHKIIAIVRFIKDHIGLSLRDDG